MVKILKHKKALAIFGVLFVYWLGSIAMGKINDRISDKIELINTYNRVIRKVVLDHKNITFAQCGLSFDPRWEVCTSDEVASGNICECNIAKSGISESKYSKIIGHINAVYFNSYMRYIGSHGDIIVGLHDDIFNNAEEYSIIVESIRRPGHYLEKYEDLEKLPKDERYDHPDYSAALAFKNIPAKQNFSVTIVPLSKFCRDEKCLKDGVTLEVYPKDM